MKTLKNLFEPDGFFPEMHQMITPRYAAERAQEILDKFIEENGVKVWGHMTYKTCGAFSTSEINGTHTAILLDIQELPKKNCLHKRALIVENKNRESWFECEDCGKPVKAKGWETV